MSGSAIAFMIFAGVVLFGGLSWALNIAAKANKK